MFTFDQLMHQTGTSVVLFYGSGCAPCERLKPKLRTMCAQLKITLAEFNSASEMEAIRALGLRSVPAVVVISAGVARVAFMGDLSTNEMAARMRLAGL
jgi:thioredoxin-like negative regulator of GroEL